MTISRGLVVAAALVAATAAAAAAWTIARPDYAWSFPRDHGAHEGYRTEWWYLTGNLRSVEEPSHGFGYQFTLFKVGVMPSAPPFDSSWSTSGFVMGHAAISDLGAGRHVFSDVLRRRTPLLGGFEPPGSGPVAWVLAPAGTAGRWTVGWNGTAFDLAMRDDAKGMAIHLTTRPLKPLVLQGPNGYSRKGDQPSAASEYYSFTRLATEGTVTLAGRTWRVHGTSWFDQEFGSSQLSDEQIGWDWFSLQLDDGRDLMLYDLRRKDGAPGVRNGTVVAADGRARYLEAGGWSARATASWISPGTGTVYPARWTIAIPSEGLVLDVVPRLAGQENVASASGGLHYWEGAVDVLDPGGKPAGRGYVELTGYGEGSRPPV